MAAPGDWDHNEVEAQLQIEHQAAQYLHNPAHMNGWIEASDDEDEPEPPPHAAVGGHALPPGFLDPIPLHPQDPYNQPDLDEEEEEEEDPEEDLEEDDWNAPIEIEEESEEEDMMEEQEPEERDDEGPEYETDDGEEFLIKTRGCPVYAMDDPTVPVSHRTLRTPGGRKWKKTSRKSVQQAMMFRFQLPSLATKGPSTTEVGGSSRPPPATPDNTSSKIAGLERRIEYLEAQLDKALRQIDRMAGQGHISGIRARVLEEDRDEDHMTITTLRTELFNARARLSDAETNIAGLQEQIDATDALTFRTENRSIDALQGVMHIQEMMERRHDVQ